MTDSEYFKWAAHDDLLGPGLLEACVDVLDRDAAVVLASPASALIDEAGLSFAVVTPSNSVPLLPAPIARNGFRAGAATRHLSSKSKLLLGYCRAMYTTKLTAQQRYDCLHAIVNRPFHAAITAGD